MNLTATPAEPVDPPTPPEPAAPIKSKPKKCRYLLTTILALICVGVLAAAGYFIFTQKKPDNTATPAPAAAISSIISTQRLRASSQVASRSFFPGFGFQVVDNCSVLGNAELVRHHNPELCP